MPALTFLNILIELALHIQRKSAMEDCVTEQVRKRGTNVF